MVLSGAAIFAVYVAGYARTQAAAAQWQTSPAVAPSAATTPGGAAVTPAAPATAGPASQAATPSARAAAGTGGAGGTPATAAANCTTTSPSTPSTAVVPPPVTRTYRRGDDDRGGRDRERRGDNEGTAFILPATQVQVPCPPGTASGQQAAAPATSGRSGQAQVPSQPAPAQSSSASRAPAQSTPPAQSSQGQAATTPAANASPYKDGVYTGTGWSRHGSVSVALTIKSGKMSSVVVTGCTTHYPCADVAPLPGEVLAAQSLQVDIVSGATDSSMAFLGAVQQALGAAQAAKG